VRWAETQGLAVGATANGPGPTINRSESPVCQLLPQPLRQLQPVAEVPTISARAANDSLTVCFRMAACSAAKLLPEPQRGSVLAGMAGGSSHFSFVSYSPWMAVPIRVIFQEGR